MAWGYFPLAFICALPGFSVYLVRCHLVHAIISAVVVGGRKFLTNGLTVSYLDIIFQFSMSHVLAVSETAQWRNLDTAWMRCIFRHACNGRIIAKGSALAVLLVGNLAVRIFDAHCRFSDPTIFMTSGVIGCRYVRQSQMLSKNVFPNRRPCLIDGMHLSVVSHRFRSAINALFRRASNSFP